MLEIKRMKIVQEEYGIIIQRYQNKILDDTLDCFDIRKMFDDIRLFWIKNMVFVRYFLSEITVEDNIAFLAGSVHVDVEENGHVEMAFSGEKIIINDPVLKVSTFFEREDMRFDNKKLLSFFRTVMTDLIRVITDLGDDFLIIPLDKIREEFEGVRMDDYSAISDQCILQMFKDEYDSIDSIAEFSYEELERKIRPEILNVLMFSSTNDIKLHLGIRIEKNINEAFGSDALKEYSDGEKFILATSQHIMQCIDTFCLGTAYNITPFVRNPILINYMIMLYDLIKQFTSVELINRCLICFYSQMILCNESVDYKDVRTKYGCENYVGAVYSTMLKKDLIFPNVSLEEIKDEILRCFKSFEAIK